MQIDLSQLDDAPESFLETLEVAPDRLDPDQVVGALEVRLEGSVQPLGEGEYRVHGRMHVAGPLLCSRCLGPQAWEADETFDVVLRPPLSGDTDDELALAGDDLDVVFLDEPTLDLERLAAEQIMLALPMRIVCREDCAGLCPRCGANRNLADACRCEPEVDPRWNALQSLKENLPS